MNPFRNGELWCWRSHRVGLCEGTLGCSIHARSLSPNWGVYYGNRSFIRENPVSRAELSRRRLFGASALGVASAAAAAGGGRGGRGGGSGGVYQHDAIIDICLWDILGKAVNRPIYQLLGGTKTRVMAYASSQQIGRAH